jgi:site-specific DNA-methyltransferase (adenine-specific)
MKLNSGFPILLSDCPWPYENERDHRADLGGMPYDTLSIDDLCAMGSLIQAVSAKDSVLLLWSTLPKIPEALRVMASWGFKFTCVPWVWIKLNPAGSVWEHNETHIVMNFEDEQGTTITPKDMLLKGGVYSGLGSWTNGNAELVLMGKRGRGCPRQSKSVKQIVFAPRGAHSVKPEIVRERINQLFGAAPGLELFARPPVDVVSCKWLKLGLEIDGLDIRESLQQVADGKYKIPKSL